MNRYGKIAQTYCRDQRPEAYQQLDSPEDHFTELGEQIQDRVSALAPQLQAAPAAAAGTDYLAKLGAMNAATRQAEEIVLNDLVYSAPPENFDQDLDPDGLANAQIANQALRDLAEVMSPAAAFDRDDETGPGRPATTS